MDLHSETEGLGGQLAAEEINVIRGALDLTNKTAAAGMTPIDKVGKQTHASQCWIWFASNSQCLDMPKCYGPWMAHMAV